ncbi:GntR family transcriptional regulator [Streptomyces triticagri]|uniref:GntR family transcriptional regulator n=2 Tax=Streptomyces triticagri TaxID=2293568 RepID=A0A372LXA4_9ACTN|nr:GntR family transcriptional regulator [Streptomyces triticagri]
MLEAARNPAYRQVADDLRRKIRAGEYQPGARVPSSRDLEKAYDIANMTARSALRVLVDEGLIRTAVGRGNFVADPLPPEPSDVEQEEGPQEQLHSAEYLELSKQVRELKAEVAELRGIFQQIAALTGPRK